MHYVALGGTGLKVSRIALGGFSFGDPAWQSWVLRERESREIIRRAVELGINFIDTADMYSDGESEAIIGRVWPECGRREEFVIATKAFHATGPSANERGLSRKHLFAAIDGSLRRLGTDYVDLYQMHRTDHTTPIEETLEAFHDIVKSGKARYFGVSNLMAWQLMRILAVCEAHGWTRPVSLQNHYNLAYREEEREMLPACRAERIGYVPWSPLARGFLAGKLARDGAAASVRAAADTVTREFFNEPHDFDVLDALRACARRRKSTPAQIALAWMLGKEGVTAPILGATRPQHVEAAVASLDIHLSAEETAELEAPYRPHRVLLHL
jgi:aryl-alcohol dehydrogenase-like predicted oxidoreductase